VALQEKKYRRKFSPAVDVLATLATTKRQMDKYKLQLDKVVQKGIKTLEDVLIVGENCVMRGRNVSGLLV
jgi:hypothetical protein